MNKNITPNNNSTLYLCSISINEDLFVIQYLKFSKYNTFKDLLTERYYSSPKAFNMLYCLQVIDLVMELVPLTENITEVGVVGCSDI